MQAQQKMLQGRLFRNHANPEMLLRFEDFHAQNPQVYEKFKEIAFGKVESKRHYSARHIISTIRWDTDVKAIRQGRFGINDHLSPFMARLFEEEFPQHKGFFRKRPAVADVA